MTYMLHVLYETLDMHTYIFSSVLFIPGMAVWKENAGFHNLVWHTEGWNLSHWVTEADWLKSLNLGPPVYQNPVEC